MSMVLIVCVAVGCGWGVLSARKVRRTAPDATIETVHRAARPVMRVSLACLVALTVPLAAEISDRFCQQLPLEVQRDVGRITWTMLVVLFAYLSSFGGTFAFLTRHRQSRQFTTALILLNVAFVLLDVRLNSAIASSLREQISKDGIVLQSSGSSCAAATVANIVRHFGKQVTEEEVAEVMGTTNFGTSPGQMRFALRRYGLEFETLNERTVDLAEVRVPAVLFIDHPAVRAEGHAVAFFGVRGDRFEVWDPLVGRVFWTPAMATDVWYGNGIECWVR